ncbi:MAG: PH domain-containing protein, partial [Acidobacteriota bacterium]
MSPEGKSFGDGTPAQAPVGASPAGAPPAQTSTDGTPPVAPPTVAAGPARHGRLPPVSLLFLILGTVRQLIIPLVASAVAAPGVFSIWLAVLVVPALLAALVRLWTFSYTLEGDELQIRQGLLTRTERNIPLQRIQNLDLVESLLHRYFGVAEVRLETASGGKPEAVIKVLTHRQISALRYFLDLRRGGADGAAAASAAATTGSAAAGATERPRTDQPPLLVQSPKDLTILGLLSNRGMLVVAAAAGLLQQAGVFDDPARFAGLGGWLPAVLPDGVNGFDPTAWTIGLGRVVLLSLLAVVAFLVATRLLSVAWMLFTLFGFTLRRRGKDFSTSYGLLTRVTATLPLRRLQLLSIYRPYLARRRRLTSLKVETAGGGASNDRQGPGSARLWLAPLVAAPLAGDLVREAMPGIEPDTVDWRPLDPRAPRRVARRNALLTFLIGLAVTLVSPGWGFLFLPLVALAGWIGLRSVRRCAWGFDRGPDGERRAIFFRSGPFDQRESLVPLGKIQCVS